MSSSHHETHGDFDGNQSQDFLLLVTAMWWHKQSPLVSIYDALLEVPSKEDICRNLPIDLPQHMNNIPRMLEVQT